MTKFSKEKYQICPPQEWASTLTDQEICLRIKDTEFFEQQTEEGRDICFFLNKNYCVTPEGNTEYVLMAYTLNQPENLERASMFDMVLEENEHYQIHRISVFRDGKLIDKIPDTTIKVFDNENSSDRGMLSSSKKINISIKDLRLNDVLIMEDSQVKIFAEKEFVRRDFVKKVFVTPDNYWAYGSYHYKFINKRDQKVDFKKCFFRDENGQLLPHEIGTLSKDEAFEFHFTEYINPVDADREVYPFVDFATQSDWKKLSNYIYPLYQEALSKNNLKEFAPDLAQHLSEFASIEEKIQYAIEFVQNNIYYIFNADEMNGHQPQLPAVTYQNKQGDCKVKCVLLKAILDELGVASSVVLVNYNTDYYLKYYLPSLLSFNHVIVKIHHNGEDYFVDATSRNEFGRLEKRSVLSFCHYMEIAQNQELKVRKPTVFAQYCIDEKVELVVLENVGKIKLTSTYRYNRANNMRIYFKNTKKREILDSWNKSLFYALNYCSDRKSEDFRDIFKEATIQIVNDDKNENEFSVEYHATIENPYFTDSQKRQFLMYFDFSVLKNSVREHQHKDWSIWHNFDSERYEIFLSTDKNIDTKEKYTIQECDIKNEFFTHKTQKEITKHSGKVIVEYNPVTNVEVSLEKIPSLKEAYNQVADSNFGIGIDIIASGFINTIKKWFK